MKKLLIDIETSPNSVHCWGLFKQNIAINQIMQTGRVMCFAAKWVGEKGIVFYSEKQDGHKKTIREAHNLIDSADAIITYNGRSFDLPTLAREFIKYEMLPPAPYHDIDLLLVARARFRFASNKLDHICGELGLGRKARHEGHKLWVDCMDGDPAAWKTMERYNRQDVVLLEKLYNVMLPWIDKHPNHGLYKLSDRPVCTNCGSTKLQSRGVQTTRTQQYVRYHCQDCGTWSRARFQNGARNKNVLTQIGG